VLKMVLDMLVYNIMENVGVIMNTEDMEKLVKMNVIHLVNKMMK
jgi:hypothetical protein